MKPTDQEWSEWLQKAVQVDVMHTVVRWQVKPEPEFPILLLDASLLAQSMQYLLA